MSLKVLYTPNEVGESEIKLNWNGYMIPGSPFKPKVVAPDLIKVIEGIPQQILQVVQAELDQERTGTVSSRPIESLEWLLPIKEKHTILFDTSAAGSGRFRV